MIITTIKCYEIVLFQCSKKDFHFIFSGHVYASELLYIMVDAIGQRGRELEIINFLELYIVDVGIGVCSGGVNVRFSLSPLPFFDVVAKIILPTNVQR